MAICLRSCYFDCYVELTSHAMNKVFDLLPTIDVGGVSCSSKFKNSGNYIYS